MWLKMGNWLCKALTQLNLNKSSRSYTPSPNGRGRIGSAYIYRNTWVRALITNTLFVILLSGCGEMSNLATISVSPSSATVGILKSQRFYATAYDQNNKIYSVAFSWSVSGGIGTIDASGLFYAGASESNGSVIATAQGISGRASVNVTTKGSISGAIKNVDGAAVSGINVYLAAAPAQAGSSDTSGRYSIGNVPAGMWEVDTSGTAIYLTASQEATVATAENTSVNMFIPYRFTVLNESGLDAPVALITGTIRNNGSTTANSVTITYVFFDDTGGVVGAALGTVGNISAGVSTPFTANPSDLIDTYSSYTRTVSAASF